MTAIRDPKTGRFRKSRGAWDMRLTAADLAKLAVFMIVAAMAVWATFGLTK